MASSSSRASNSSATCVVAMNSKDIAYEYGTVMDPAFRTHITCNFCNKKITAGITRFKEHLVHKNGNTTGCPKVPAHVQVRIQRAFNEAIAKKSERARISNICAEGGAGEEHEFDNVETESEGRADDHIHTTTTNTTITNATSSRKRKPTSDVRGPMDIFAKKKTSVQTALDASNPVKQKLKMEAWDSYARWAYSAGISFNAVHDPNFQKFIYAVGEYGRGQWWNMHGLCAPELQNFAMRVLGQTCSASPCERNWSAFDNLHTKKRNCLLQLTLNKLVYIQYNMKLERRFKDAKNKSKTFDPIVLREVEENDDWIIPNEEELADLVWEDDDLQWHTVRAAMGADEHVGPSTRARTRLQRADSFEALMDHDGSGVNDDGDGENEDGGDSGEDGEDEYVEVEPGED